jgi:hypothetical protein
MTRSPLALLIAMLPLAASAQTIYKCVDGNGATTYASSRLEKNCKVISSGAENSFPAPRARKPTGATANPSPADFPRVQEDAQKARDGDRRHILEQELSGEQRNLKQAREDLSAQQAAGVNGGALAPYLDRVGRHERNIQAIEKELGNSR